MLRSLVALRRSLAALGLCAAATAPMMAPGTAQAYWIDGHHYYTHCYHCYRYGWHGYGWRPGVAAVAPVDVAPPVVYVPPAVVYRPYPH
jgi:hypothetical protein